MRKRELIIINIVCLLFIVLGIIYVGSLFVAGYSQNELIPHIEEESNSKIKIIDEKQVGNSTVILFKTKKTGTFGDAVFVRIGPLNRYNEYRVEMLGNIKEDLLDSQMVDDSWNQYIVNLTPKKIQVKSHVGKNNRALVSITYWLSLVVILMVCNGYYIIKKRREKRSEMQET